MNARVNAADLSQTTFPITPRSMPHVLLSLIRNPLDALPPEIFTEPMVFTKVGGKLRIYLADPELIYQALVRNSDALGKGEASGCRRLGIDFERLARGGLSPQRAYECVHKASKAARIGRTV